MRNYVTVEPSLFVYILLYEWMDVFNTNLYLQKSCRFNATIEPDLSTKCDDEKAGVLFISEVNSKYRLCEFLLVTLVTILGTTWSDKAGRRRRPLIYIAILGQIIVSISGCVHSYFWHWRPLLAAIPSTIFCGLNGGPLMMIVACQIYLCETNDVKKRTMKLGFLNVIYLTCVILGKGASGIILRRIGFFYSYLLCLVLASISLIFGLLFIKDNSIPLEKEFRFYQIFNVKRIFFDNFKVVFNKKLGRKRVIVAVLIFLRISWDFTSLGEMSVLYSYLRYRFGFDEQKYSVFSFFKFSVATLGTLFGSVVLSKWLKIHDGLIGILAGSFDLVAIAALMFATQMWQIFMVPLIDLFHSCVGVVSLSFLSKYYTADELGRLQSVSGVLSFIVPCAFPAYNAIFQATLTVLPSAFCILSVVLDLGIILCFCASYFLSKKFDAEKPTKVETETQSMMATAT